MSRCGSSARSSGFAATENPLSYPDTPVRHIDIRLAVVAFILYARDCVKTMQRHIWKDYGKLADDARYTPYRGLTKVTN